MIKKRTSNNISSFFTGLLSTIVLESSNLVSVIVLSFVGTGILTETHALAVMLGSNVGTTMTSALFGAVWVGYDINMIVFPLLFLGAIGISFFKKREIIQNIWNGFIGFWVIFLALSFMKSGMMFLTEMVDLSAWMDMPTIFFFAIGLVITTLIQSGTATFMIALTSLHSGLISLNACLGIFLWAYLWSTITIILASIGGHAIKKQVAAGHVWFNIFVGIMGLSTMPLLQMLFENYLIPQFWLINSVIGFYVGFRALCALLVLPFVNQISLLFQKYITEQKSDLQLAIQRIEQPLDTELSILALKQDILLYLKMIIKYNLNIRDFYLTDIKNKEEKAEQELLLKSGDFGKNYIKDAYIELKNIQENLLDFLVQLNQKNNNTTEEVEKNTTLYQIILGIGDSSKYLKDVRDRVEDRKRSTSETSQKDYATMRKMVLEFYQDILEVLVNLDNNNSMKMLHEILDQITRNDKKYITMYKKESTDLKLSNLIQVNRYFSLSCTSLVNAIEKINLTKEEKKYIKESF